MKTDVQEATLKRHMATARTFRPLKALLKCSTIHWRKGRLRRSQKVETRERIRWSSSIWILHCQTWRNNRIILNKMESRAILWKRSSSKWVVTPKGQRATAMVCFPSRGFISIIKISRRLLLWCSWLRCPPLTSSSSNSNRYSYSLEAMAAQPSNRVS